MPVMEHHTSVFSYDLPIMLIISKQDGYTYFGILFVVALIGFALTGASLITQVEQQREKEKQLLFIGQQYINAIASYYNDAPGGNKHYPRKLNELLRDPRFPNIKRHLRKPWLDPLTLSFEWGIVHTKQGGIAGIYSLGKGAPFKRAGFETTMPQSFLANKNSYRDWKFIYIASTDDRASPTTTDIEVDINAIQTSINEVNQADITPRSEVDNQNKGIDAELETGEELLQ